MIKEAVPLPQNLKQSKKMANHYPKLTSMIMACLLVITAEAQVLNTPESQMEYLNRGLVAVAGQTKGVFLSWRLLGTDPDDVTFDVIKNDNVIASGIKTTNYLDETGTAASKYAVRVNNGPNAGKTGNTKSWGAVYKTLNLEQPEGGSTVSGDYTYTPNDCSVGDVDGDGKYEIFVKWMPSLQNHSISGVVSGPIVLDCYNMSGTKLWRVNLGKNIMASDHVTQFMVYDFDGDGKAEMICKTAPGSVDGQGNYVSAAATDESIKNTDNTADYVDRTPSTDPSTGATTYKGFVSKGPEFLTVFNGQTGAAMHTIYYRPNRQCGWGGAPDGYGDPDLWGDNYGGRAERHLACVAFLDGPDSRPSAVMCRGIYRRVNLWAVDWDGTQLKQKWLHVSKSVSEVEHYDANNVLTTKIYNSNTFNHEGAEYTSFTAYGQGAHSVTVGDVDGDGCDEIVYGGATIDHDGQLLYSTGLGHGDALHLGDFDPDRPGLEVYMIHEQYPYGSELHDAKTGEPLWRRTANGDTGRGVCFDIDANYRGNEFWSSAANTNVMAIDGTDISVNKPSMNFRVFWDGDLQDELFDAGYVDKWTGDKATRIYPYIVNNVPKNFYDAGSTCNDSKATPCLIADITGDWREEIILRGKNDAPQLVIFTTNVPTEYRVPCLMHDHTYRMAIAWQNTGYNQPPHLGYYLPDYVAAHPIPTGIQCVAIESQQPNQYYDLQGRKIANSHLKKGLYIMNGKKVMMGK